MADLPLPFLSLPRAGDRTSVKLIRKVRLIALKHLLTMSASDIDARSGAALRQIQGVLQRMVRTSPDVVLDVVGQPDVQVPLLVLVAGLRPSGTLIRQLVPNLLAALMKHREHVPEALLWEQNIDSLVLVGEGQIEWDPALKALLMDSSGLALEDAGGKRVNVQGLADAGGFGEGATTLIHPVASDALDLHLSLFDTNPLSMDEAHPDKAGNSISLGGHPVEEWLARLEEALGLIKLALPTWYEEMKVTTRRILPVGYEPEMHLSASYREAPGIVYMTLHPDPLTMAEALIHETQHGKLNLLSWLDPVLHNAYTDWCDSPVRPDLRPVMGVLLAVHAFAPVAALHHQLAALKHPISQTPRFRDRRQEVLAGNAGALSVVEDVGEPSVLGRKVVAGLRELHDAVALEHDSTAWGSDAMPPG